MQTAQVIPFQFDAREVRTLLIDDQPWFVAADVSCALEYRIAGDMTRNLDDDEKGTQIVRTPGGDQEMLVINESGLYSAILRSRKAEAKRFKKWVTAEVLPAIRKHGRYEDSSNKMATLVGETIGTDELPHARLADQGQGSRPPRRSPPPRHRENLVTDPCRIRGSVCHRHPRQSVGRGPQLRRRLQRSRRRMAAEA